MTDAPTETAGAQEITIRRVFDAPRELVWQAWTDPEQLAQWWGPRGWSTTAVTIELIPGGAFRVDSVSEDGAKMPTVATVREVVEPERLVVDEVAEDAWHDGAVSVLVLKDLGDGRTEMVFTSTIRTTDDMRDVAAGGLASAFDRLAEVLA